MALKVTIDGTDRTSVLQHESLEVEQVAGAFVTICSFTLIDETSALTITSKEEVLVEENVSAMKYFKGRIAGVEDEKFSQTGRLIHIDCQDFNTIPHEYVIDGLEEYGATRDDVIIDDLFDTYATGVIDSETFVAHLYAVAEISFENMTLAAALDKICQLSQGAWYIDDLKKLHYFSAEATDAPWDLSDEPDNVDTFSYLDLPTRKEDATQVITRVLVSGADAAIWSINAAAEAALGAQFAAVVHDNTLLGVDDVTARGATILDRYSYPLVTYIVTVAKEGLKAGMDIGFKCDLLGADDDFTIHRLTIRWPDGIAHYELEIGDPQLTAAGGASGSYGHQIEAERPIPIPLLPVSSRGWSHNIVFSATDFNTVEWADAGVITLADGTEYTIDDGTTGNIAETKYIYLDIESSVTVLQITNDASVVVGRNKLLICVAENVADEDTNKAIFQAFGGQGVGVMVGGNNIIADSITINEMAANSIDTGNIIAGAITTDELDAGAVTAAKIAAHTITATRLDMGSATPFFNVADGLLLLGPNCEINATEWWSLRRQEVTLSGAFRQVAGYWPGTKALVVEPAGTNLCTNPVFGVDTTGWSKGGTNTIEWNDARAVASAGSLKCVYVDSLTLAFDQVVFPGEGDYVLTAWVWVTANYDGDSMSLRPINCVGSSFNVISDWEDGDPRRQWVKLQTKITIDVGDLTGVCAIMLVGAPTLGFVSVDAVQWEATAYATSLIWGGAGPGYAWTGTAHDSTSTRTATEVNLDTLTSLATGNNTLSFRFVVQMPYDADAVDTPSATNLLDLRGASEDHRIDFRYNAAVDKFYLYLNGDDYFQAGSAQTFDAGDWLDIVVTLDYTADDYRLYINGILHISDTGTVTAPTLTEWNLGTRYNGTAQSGLAFAEYTTFDRVLTADEVAALHAYGRPSIDVATIDAPGIYILDGRFRIASSQTGNRIEITPDEIAGYDSVGVKQFYLQSSDGKAVAGAGEVILDDTGIIVASTVYLDEDGIILVQGTGDVNKIKWYNTYGGTQKAAIWSQTTDAPALNIRSINPASADDSSYIFIYALANAGADAKIELRSHSTISQAQINLIAEGVYVDCPQNEMTVKGHILPQASLTYNLGSPSLYWMNVYYKNLIDLDCLGDFFSDGVELVDGELVPATEALRRIKPRAKGLTVYDRPLLDYATMPKAVYRPSEDGDGAELSALVSVQLAAIRELTRRVEELEAQREKLDTIPT